MLQKLSLELAPYMYIKGKTQQELSKIPKKKLEGIARKAEKIELQAEKMVASLATIKDTERKLTGNRDGPKMAWAPVPFLPQHFLPQHGNGSPAVTCDLWQQMVGATQSSCATAATVPATSELVARKEPDPKATPHPNPDATESTAEDEGGPAILDDLSRLVNAAVVVENTFIDVEVPQLLWTRSRRRTRSAPAIIKYSQVTP